MNKQYIENHEDKMTIYYRKHNGEIKMISDGIHDMSIFGNEQCDYDLIWECLVIDKLSELKDNSNLFIVNTENKTLQIKQEFINSALLKVGE